MMASSKEENSDLPPINNNVIKGTLYNVFLTQFTRAVGLMATRTVAHTKIRRTTFLNTIN